MWSPDLDPSYGSSNGFVAELKSLRPSADPRSMNAAVCKAAGVRENTGPTGGGPTGGGTAAMLIRWERVVTVMDLIQYCAEEA